MKTAEDKLRQIERMCVAGVEDVLEDRPLTLSILLGILNVIAGPQPLTAAEIAYGKEAAARAGFVEVS